MQILYIFLFILLLLTSYFFGLPLYKKRPIILKQLGLMVYSFVLTGVAFSLVELWVYLAITLTLLYSIVLLRPWFVYGVTTSMLSEALQKAATATRSPIEQSQNTYKIDNSIEIRLWKVGKKINLILFRRRNQSKKAELTKIVFKKFIQNYFI